MKNLETGKPVINDKELKPAIKIQADEKVKENVVFKPEKEIKVLVEDWKWSDKNPPASPFKRGGTW